MGREKIKKFALLLKTYSFVSLDATCFIYHIEENPTYIPFTEIIFEILLPQNMIQLVCSTVVVTELLTLPYRDHRDDLILKYKAILTGIPNLNLVPVTLSIADKAAELRGKYSLRTPDALHIASAIIAGANVTISNDKRWKKVKEIDVILLDDFVTPGK